MAGGLIPLIVLQLAVVCTISASSLASQENTRATFVGEFGGHKYWLEPGPYMWYNGKLACEASGWQSVAIETQAEHDFLLQALGGSPRNYWTSGRERYGSQIEHHEWYDSGLPVRNLGGASGWLDCVAFYPGQYTWRFEPCNTYNAVLCEETPKSEMQHRRESKPISLMNVIPPPGI